MTAEIIGMILTIIFLLILVIIRQIDWFQIAINWVGNDPSRCQVYYSAGDTFRTCQGIRIYTGTTRVSSITENGRTELHPVSVYCYKKPKSKISQLICVDDATYPFDYIRGRRLIGITDGMLVPNPLGGWPELQRNKYAEGVLEFGDIFQSQIVNKALESIRSNKVTNMLLIGVIVIVIAGGCWWYFTQQGKNDQVQPKPPVTANVTTTQKPSTPPVTIVPKETAIP